MGRTSLIPEFPPSVLLLQESDGDVVLSVPSAEVLETVAEDVLSARLLSAWYPEGAHDALRERVVARVTRAVTTGAWELLREASDAWGHRLQLLPLTPSAAYAAR